MKCIYHDDLDGRCAAHIINLYYQTDHFMGNWNANKSDFIGMDYKKTLNLNLIAEGETVWIVDFSFEPEFMSRILNKAGEVTWIDHHKTVIDHPYNALWVPGIRSTRKAACELTWNYCFPKEPIPTYVALIGDYDTWTFSLINTEAFHIGLCAIDTHPLNNVWRRMKSETYVEGLIDAGDTCRQFRDKVCENYISRFGFSVTFNGYKCLICNGSFFGAKLFREQLQNYDIGITCTFNGDKWNISLYSERDDIDVSLIAKQYGGGGHKGASGFTSPIPIWEMEGVIKNG